MKFTCTQSDLKSNLAIALRAVPSRCAHPILANIKIEVSANPSLIRFTGFDLFLGIQTSFIADVEEDGVITLPAKLLYDIVAKLPSGDVTLDDSVGENLVTITALSGVYKVKSTSAEEYPDLPTITEGTTHKFAAPAFIDGIAGSLIACSEDESKQILTGVHLTISGDTVEFAATDGHRLGIMEIAHDNSHEDGELKPFKVTVPAKTLHELEKVLIAGKHETVEVQMDQSQIVFKAGDFTLISSILEGKYPDYWSLIAKSFSREVLFDRQLFLDALNRTSVFVDTNNLVMIGVNSQTNSLNLLVENQVGGRGQDAVAAKINGDDISLAFNIELLVDGLKSIRSKEVSMELNGATFPVIFKPVGGKGLHLVMPVKVSQ